MFPNWEQLLFGRTCQHYLFFIFYVQRCYKAGLCIGQASYSDVDALIELGELLFKCFNLIWSAFLKAAVVGLSSLL